MNEKLQKIYYIIGIIQRIGMILLTVAIIGASYKIYSLSEKSMKIMETYRTEISGMKTSVDNLYKLLDKSWFF
jgi:hypothetical protein